MMFYTHLAFSFLIALLITKILTIEQEIFFIVIVCFFGTFPDIDTYKSKIGRKLPVISFFMNLIFRHRRLFHSLFIPILLYLVFLAIGYEFISLAILIGYASHIILDAITKSGIQLLWPFFSRIRGFIRTNSMLEKILFLFLCIVDIYIIVFY